eukprot:CAMPEP_0184688256 /NCGR_PEP_ID=MMETSP0312-20130426/29143_1 /TAXON_ID=31354 /ORGANISM="Compsopogon coeruleus, Strain SAG 36.94" /LENGTH=246 /DNA_ID=CAMNT_0027145187 /DNA_START=139 /DNA_END=879 /DNA_ORIENTATION=-
MEKKNIDWRMAKRRNPLVFEDYGGVRFRTRSRLCLRDEVFLREMMRRCHDEMFVVTDSSLYDNPIIYASPCFLRYTQYAQAEVVGRNCRFLQGEHTRAWDVRRIRSAIQKMEECTVTLLNYKKDGTAFWNQFFIAPLRKRNTPREQHVQGSSPQAAAPPGCALSLRDIFSSQRRGGDLFIGIQCESRQANRSIIENFGANFRYSQPLVISQSDYETLFESDLGVWGSPIGSCRIMIHEGDDEVDHK